jgi:uncharacterized protein (TIGR04255 family)
MPIPRPLKNPPITEAVIDLRIKPRVGFHVSDLEPVIRALNDEFSERAEIRMRELMFAFEVDAEKMSSRRHDAVGYRLRSPRTNHVVQISLNGLTFSWLRPYSTWGALREAALTVWEIYAAEVQPEGVIRAAVRYINHISLPLPILDLRDYLPMSPNIPEHWPQSMSGFLSRIAVVEEEPADQAIITQTSERGADPQTMTFLLDVDCFTNRALPSISLVPETLDRLRILKNRIFFDSVTELLLERFE